MTVLFPALLGPNRSVIGLNSIRTGSLMALKFWMVRAFRVAKIGSFRSQIY